ncbi:MAG: hypothetical protein N7Q72_06005 [Spiroplasma sp. Tabriz.8]|nr:hypothetical protein [Spiroplasma sp. Tabriz.8]
MWLIWICTPYYSFIIIIIIIIIILNYDQIHFYFACQSIYII